MANLAVSDGAEVRKLMVVERLGYDHSIGRYAAIVKDGDRERTVVKTGKVWRFWGAQDRIRPLVEHIARCEKNGEPPFLQPGVRGQ